jgi:two-component system, NarL family, nitrate/nitrite response regulator NarL
MVQIVVISGVRLYREGLVELLEQSNGIRVLGSAGDGPGAVGCIVAFRPDVALLDMATAASVGMLPTLREASPRLRIVGLAVDDDEPAILAAVEAGVTGYVHRRDSLNDLVRVIHSVARDEAVSSPRIVASLMRRLAILASQPPPDALAERLTIREAEIVSLVAQGMTNKEIARHLFIQLPTVKNHIHNILNKLQLQHRGQAAALANHRHLDPRI